MNGEAEGVDELSVHECCDVSIFAAGKVGRAGLGRDGCKQRVWYQHQPGNISGPAPRRYPDATNMKIRIDSITRGRFNFLVPYHLRKYRDNRFGEEGNSIS